MKAQGLVRYRFPLTRPRRCFWKGDTEKSPLPLPLGERIRSSDRGTTGAKLPQEVRIPAAIFLVTTSWGRCNLRLLGEVSSLVLLDLLSWSNPVLGLYCSSTMLRNFERKKTLLDARKLKLELGVRSE